MMHEAKKKIIALILIIFLFFCIFWWIVEADGDFSCAGVIIFIRKFFFTFNCSDLVLGCYEGEKDD